MQKAPKKDFSAKTLAALKTGVRAKVVEIHAGHAVTQRIMALGLLPGCHVRVVQVAPLGDPIAIEFSGRRVSLRKADAAAVVVDAPQQ